MTANRSRRPLLKRIALWTAAIVLFLAGYVASAPVVVWLAYVKLPVAKPVAIAIYAPVFLYVSCGGPGVDAYTAYDEWWSVQLSRLFL